MSLHCAACGVDNLRVSLGGVKLCSTCDPKIREQVDALRSLGKPVDISRLALAMFRAENSVGSYLLRDIPTALWDEAKHAAVDRGVSLRELLLDALRDAVRKGNLP